MIVAFVIHIHPLSSPLLLRISPHTFAFIPIQPMNLSSRNRSNSKAFRLILPCVASVCEGMHYHKTGVPWQMKSTFIIVLFLLVLPRNALFFEGFRVSCSLLWNYRLCQIRAEPCKLLLPVSSKMERVTTKDFIRHPYSTSVYTNNSIFDVYHIVFQLLPYYVILALLTDDTQICALIPLSHIPYLSP